MNEASTRTRGAIVAPPDRTAEYQTFRVRPCREELDLVQYPDQSLTAQNRILRAAGQAAYCLGLIRRF
jgi:hypothetical protein